MTRGQHHERLLVRFALPLALALGGCTHDDGPPGAAEGGSGQGGSGQGGSGQGGSGCSVACSADDPFDTAQCPANYPSGGGCVVYVDDAAEASGDGWSWQGALTSAQSGIDQARCGVLQAGACERWQVWVAGGSYHTHQGCRSDTVRLRPGVDVYGGFSGSEVALGQRDWLSHETILDGRNRLDDSSHVYHVVTGADDALLDGFTVTAGRADGGGSDDHGGGMYNVGSSPTVVSCTFRDNVAAADGGGMHSAASSSVTVEQSLFEGNRAADGGGGLSLVDGSMGEITGCTFRANVQGAFTGALTGDGGGAISVRNSSMLVSACAFEDNEAHGEGGAVCSRGSTVTISDSSFDDNHNLPADLDHYPDGGALFISGGPATVTGSTFTNNWAMGGGGALTISGPGHAVVEDCLFSGNRTDEVGHGGGVQISSAAVELTSSTFSGNLAISGGGVTVEQSGSATVTMCAFTGNSGSGLAVLHNSSATVVDTSFEANSGGSGGGVMVVGGVATLSRCIIRDNQAHWGGGLWLFGNATVEVVNSAVSGNTASGTGGAIGADATGSLTLLNCSVAGNSAVDGGGAIYGVADLTVSNSILWANTPDEVAESGGQALSVSYSDVAGGHAGTGNMGVDPVLHSPGFVDLGAGDLHLSAGSPCIDAANGDGAPDTDLDGSPRVDVPATPNGPACGLSCPDMGAYEYQ